MPFFLASHSLRATATAAAATCVRLSFSLPSFLHSLFIYVLLLFIYHSFFCCCFVWTTWNTFYLDKLSQWVYAAPLFLSAQRRNTHTCSHYLLLIMIWRHALFSIYFLFHFSPAAATRNRFKLWIEIAEAKKKGKWSRCVMCVWIRVATDTANM